MKDGRSRREFMGLTVGAVAGTVGSPWFSRTVAAAAGAEAGDADLVVTNAKVYSVDSRLPRAEAFAVSNGRFIAVGTNDEIAGLVGADTRTIDAGQSESPQSCAGWQGAYGSVVGRRRLG